MTRAARHARKRVCDLPCLVSPKSHTLFVDFIWDDKKATLNLKNHNVAFEEAKTVFLDPNAVMDFDTAKDEVRLTVIGISSETRMLFVVSIELEDDLMRLISARPADPEHEETYREQFNAKNEQNTHQGSRRQRRVKRGTRSHRARLGDDE